MLVLVSPIFITTEASDTIIEDNDEMETQNFWEEYMPYYYRCHNYECRMFYFDLLFSRRL